MYTTRNCGQPPEHLSNHFYYEGATNLLNSSKYRCMIKVVALNVGNCQYEKTYFWTERGGTMWFKAPSNASFQLTINYYERCNNCAVGQTNKRPTFRSSKTINPNAGTNYIYPEPKMLYLATSNCQ